MASNNDKVLSTLSSASFQKLLRIRSAVRFTLAFLIVVLHGFFVGGIAWYQQWFSQPIYQGSSIPTGIAVAAVVIVLMVLLEVVYIGFSKTVFDPLQRQVLSQVDDHE